MSNTSLTPIKIPKLNSADFGKSIMQAFENIDLNFQKLANLDVNKGAPGRSCVYVPIHLGAAFVYDAYDVNDTQYSDCYNAFYEWKKRFDDLETDHGDAWKNLIKEVDEAYKQYNTITGKSKQEYARLACVLLWGNPCPFGFGSTPQPGSLTAVLHEHYKGIDGAAKMVYPDGTEVDMYGDWLYELYKYNPVGSTNDPNANLSEIRRIIGEYYNFFSTHFGVVGIGKVVMALSPDPVYSSYHPVGSFEYWYVDPRYRCGIEPSGESVTGDISCVLRWVTDTYENGNNVTWDGHFEILEIFPTIRVGENGEYRWHINGMDTGIPVQGKPGQDGKSTQMLVVERIENVRGWHPTTAPNGEDFWSPKSGAQVFRMLNYSGVPSRVLNNYSSFTGKLESNFEFTTRKNAPAPLSETTIKAGFDRTTDYTGRVTQFVMTEEKPWLSVNADEQTKNIAEVGYLFRIFRIVGREKFYTYGDAEPDKAVMATDEYDRAGDPSCDVYYFGHEGASHISEEQSIQELIKELDGSLAIVLPGPAYKHDRTDTAFWFATLRAVKTDNPDVFELVAYCSPHAQQTTQLDEHSQVGMMQSFDAYTHKSTSDNRNKPRGLMLPIGSSLATSGNFTDTWAAHVIHSDTGGFIGYKGGSGDRRGYQDVISDNATNEAFTGGVGRLSNNLNKNVGVYNGQFTEVINKRILHVGSVNDYRALNYVEDAPQNYTKGGKTIHTLNGAVPGRVATGDENGLIGNATFFGETVNGWFIGSELHVDEPVTITRYRDLKPKGRLLDVEGDVVIGPHTHKNLPDIKYRHCSGGLFVASTLTNETLNDDLLTNPNDLIFPKDLITGKINLSFEPYIKPVKALTWDQEIDKNAGDILNDVRGSRSGVWRSKIGRFHQTRSLRSNSSDVLKGKQMSKTDEPLFSGIFDDTIGARLLITMDGFAIYNPMEIGEGKAINVPFSVDAFGNIQTYGREIRSNADDAAWYFHTRWPLSIATNGNAKVMLDGKETSLIPPTRNKLVFASDHEININQYNTDAFKTRYWRTSNNPATTYVDAKMQNDPCEVVSGYFHTFGFADETGRSTTTFPHGGLNDGSAKIFDANEYLPTILSMPVDLQYLWGAFICRGINPRASWFTLEGQKQLARFGGAIKYGLVISEPARKTMKTQDGKVGISYNEFIGDPLTVQYCGIIPLTAQDGDEYKDTCGCEAIDMFGLVAGNENGIDTTEIGIWNRHGMVVEKSMIVCEDLLGYRGLSIRGQSRSKSFRRHILSALHPKNNAFIDPNSDPILIKYPQKSFAFLLDNGWSSTPAPQILDNPKKLFESNVHSPIVLDLGEAYGPGRLIKFGQVGSVDLSSADNNYDLTLNNELQDYQTALFGWNPTDSMYKYGVRRDGLKHSGINGFEVNALCNALWAQVSITIDLDAKSYSNDAYHDKNGSGWSAGLIRTGHKHRTTAYGIAVEDNWKQGDRCTEKTEPEIIFDGFKWNDIFVWKDGHLPFPKPMHNVDVWVGAAFKGSTKCNWYPTGTNSARDRQFGALFRLTPSGRLTMPYYMHPEALTSMEGQTLTLTFTYPVAPKNMKKLYIFAVSTNMGSTKDIYVETPDKAGTIFDDLSRIDEVYKDYPSKDWRCVWYKAYTGFDNRYENENDLSVWNSVPWTLYKAWSEVKNTFYKSPRVKVDDDGNMWPADASMNIITSAGQLTEAIAINVASVNIPGVNEKDPFNEEIEDSLDDPIPYYNLFVNKEDRCLWKYSEVTTADGKTEEFWTLIYEYDPASKSGGYFAQRTNCDIFGNTFIDGGGLAGFVRNNKLVSSIAKKDKEITVQSGAFKALGGFTGLNVDDAGFVIGGKLSESMPSNVFSVNYWETGGMSYLRISIVVDKKCNYTDYGRTQAFGFAFGADLWKVNRRDTKIYLPFGAKLPKTPVSAYFGGMSHAYDTNKDMDTSGSLWFRLETTGQVTLPYEYSSRSLIQGRGPNQDFTNELQLIQLTFEYQPSDETMQENHYTEVDESGEMANEDGFKDPGIGDPIAGDDSADETSDNWTWDRKDDPTEGTLKAWILNEKRSVLKDFLNLDIDNGGEMATSAPFGTVSVKCTSDRTVNGDGETTKIGKKLVSLWVTADSSEGAPSTHRSITFNWDNGEITDIHSVLLEKNFNPGYYGSNKATDDEKSPIDPKYIGTTNNRPDDFEWIWYTNDGKQWIIIKRPIDLDLGYVYVLSTDNSLYLTPDQHKTPAGILGTFDASDNITIYNGSNNYIPVQSLVSPDGADNWVHNTTTNTVIGNLSGEAGHFKMVKGFSHLWKMKISNWNNLELRKKVESWEEVNVTGLFAKETWYELSKTFVDPGISIPMHCKAYWMKKTGTNDTTKPFETDGGDNRAISIRHDEFKDGPGNPEKYAKRIENWFATALNYYLINTNNDPKHASWKERKYALFSNETGWASQWDSLSIFQEHNGSLYVNLANETHINPPTTPNGGADPIPSLRCEWHVDVQHVWGSIKGNVIMSYGKFDRAGIDAPTGYNYLCAEYGIESKSSAKLTSDYVERMSIPKVLKFEANLIFQEYSGKLYNIYIKDNCDGSTVIFTKTEVEGGSSSTYDDSALISRISTLEGKSHDKPGNATTTSDGLMSKEDKEKLDGLGTSGDYELPTASSTVKGGIKVGSGLKMTDEIMSVEVVSDTKNGLMTKEDKVKLDNLAFIETTIQPTARVFLTDDMIREWFDEYSLNDGKTLKRMANKILRSSHGETQVLLFRFHGRVDNALMNVDGRTGVPCDCFMYSTGLMHNLTDGQQTMGKDAHEMWLVIWKERGTDNVGLTSIWPEEPGGSGGGGSSYDDTDIKRRIAALESTDSWLDDLWITSDIGVRANGVSITESDPTDDPSGLYVFSDREMKGLGHTVQRYYRIPVATPERDGAMSAADKEQLDWLWEHRNDESSGGGSGSFGHEITGISFGHNDEDTGIDICITAKNSSGETKYFNKRIPTASNSRDGVMSSQDKIALDRLKERVTALENMLTLIQESPLAVNLSLADGATTATLNLTGTDVNGNDVNFNIEHNSDSDVTIS